MEHAPFAKAIYAQHAAHGCMLPLKSKTQIFANRLVALIFPHFAEQRFSSEDQVEASLTLLQKELEDLLISFNDSLPTDGATIARRFFAAAPAIHASLLLDAEAIYSGDPAAKSLDEVILAYPGFMAITLFRFAHLLHGQGVPVIPRILTEYAHQITGIDIHPGANIGKSFCIDHGTGIVIGETTVIGDNVKIYQGVTLGALSVSKDLFETKRHPTIEDNVVVYAQAVILGGDTTVGRHSVIGGNVWLTKSVPPYSLVVHHDEIRFREAEPFLDPISLM
jgi:serine O-acetyltransferase